MNDVKNVLIYCPNIGGHRLIHVLHYINFLKKENKNIYFYYSGLRESAGKIINSPDLVKDNQYLEIILNDTSIKTIQFEYIDSNRKRLKELVKFQSEHLIDSTIFVDGDENSYFYVSQLLPFHPKLLGKNGAYFFMSEFLYNPPKYPSKLKVKYWLFNAIFFKYFKLLDYGFFTDENIVKTYGDQRYIHIPDYIPVTIPNNLPEKKQRFYKRIESNLETFLDDNRDKEILLSFGDLENRKGFDFLLQLAAEQSDLAIIRMGRIKPGYTPRWFHVNYKEQLIIENRIFSVETYIEKDELIDSIFKKAKFLLLPYRNFYRTSGVLLQALSHDLPVLTPDTGLFKTRTIDNGIGEVFQHENYDSFKEGYLRLKENLESYQCNIVNYKKDFTLEVMYEAFQVIISKGLPTKYSGQNFSKGNQIKFHLSWTDLKSIFIILFRKFFKIF